MTQQRANHAASGNGAIAVLLRIEHPCRAVPECERWGDAIPFVTFVPPALLVLVACATDRRAEEPAIAAASKVTSAELPTGSTARYRLPCKELLSY